MKLSEAILLGSIGTEQARGFMMDADGKTCALGGAYLAAGFKLCRWIFSFNTEANTQYYNNICSANAAAKNLWPVLSRIVEHPIHPDAPEIGKCHLSAVIINLNDVYKWTRPQIATWVAKIEQQMEVESIPIQLAEMEVTT